MAMTPLPTPPSRNDPANFAERGDSFLAALPTFVTEANALQEDVTAKQATASSAATTSTQKAADASDYAATANQAKTGAEAARDTAQTHRNAAEAAKNAAEDAAVDAGDFAASASASAAVLSSASDVLFNVLINSNFGENKRAVSGTVTLAAGAYGHDRWKAGAAGCTYTFSNSGGVTTLNITAGSLIQVIEGEQLHTGTHVLCWTGTAQGKIGAGSYSSSGVTASVAGGTNLNVEFGTGTLSCPHLRPGSAVLPWSPYRGIYGGEKQACLRYCRAINTSAAYLGAGLWYTPSLAIVHLPFIGGMMRAAPSIEFNSAVGGVIIPSGSASASISMNSAKVDGATLALTYISGSTAVAGMAAVASVASGLLILSAEL
ncbi:MAG TPA: hypothetical protein VIM12_05920 [Noviherbaspirillum sp.]|jgi:hypothetical protein|uniref:hypothetical protein n=1 Tax=Noviherbaspirillum sp. TaxID=1926288 RepID=UPI002F920EB1